jgi:regulator of replication initiation timing
MSIDLKFLRTKLKIGEYDGTDIMQAWLCIDRLIKLEDENEEHANTITTIRENFAEVWKRNAVLNAENHQLRQNTVECEEFYNLMQAYRHVSVLDQESVSLAYQDVINFINKGK